jgi:bacterioferritin
MPESIARSHHRDLAALRDAIAYCDGVRDFVPRTLLADILKAEEEHIDFIETQLTLIPRLGIENYLQLQSGSAESEE